MNRYILTACVLGLAFLQACDAPAESTGRGDLAALLEEGVAPEIRVATTFPEARSFAKDIRVMGTATPREAVDIVSMEAGQIREVRVDVGDRVEAGDTLVMLHNPSLEQAYRAAKSNFDFAVQNHSRHELATYEAPGIVSAAQMDVATAAAIAADAALETATERLAYLTILAPMSGTVAERSLHPGAVVESGLNGGSARAILRIEQCRQLRFLLPFPEHDARFVLPGAALTMFLPDLGDSLTATIKRLAPVVDSRARTLDALVDIDQRTCRIRPGMMVEAALHAQSDDSLPSLPHKARWERDGLAYITVVREGRALNLPIKVLAEDKAGFAFRARSMEPGDAVILTGRNLLSEGQAVTASPIAE